MQPYIPLNILESIAAERRADPRVVAAAGYPLTSAQWAPRRSFGDALVRFGHWIAGEVHHREHTPDAAEATAPAMT